MIQELLGRVDEMVGAGLLTGVALYAMYSGMESGIPEMCITGVVALLATRAARANNTE